MNSGNSQLRLFFALWPDAQEQAALAAWQRTLRVACGGRAMRPETLHTTLVFLGDVAVHRLEALQLAAQETEGDKFELVFAAARYWGHNHIVFAAPPDTPPQLQNLVNALEQRMVKHRFRFDQRPYRPHVTMLRNARWSDAPLPEVPAVRWKVGDFALVRSLSDETGARYEVLARFPLVTRGISCA